MAAQAATEMLASDGSIDADPDIPILQQAKQEYDRLK